MEGIKRFIGGSPDKVQRVLKLAVTRIIVHEERVEIELSKRLLRTEVLGNEIDIPAPSGEADNVTLQTSAQLKRCGGEVRFLLPPDSNHSKSHSVPSLIRAVARAHDWVARILKGDSASQRSIAEETGLDERYISRIIPLAFLAPDLTEAILEGTHSAHLSLENLLGNVPSDWVQQRAVK
jgi:hypothetical protein